MISLIHGPARTLVVDHVLQRFAVLSTSVRVDLGEAVPDLRAYDAVIFAGGEYRPEEFEEPFFQAERERILDALQVGVPILGICLGNQLLAYWLGGEVNQGRWEMGWLPVEVNYAGLLIRCWQGWAKPSLLFCGMGTRSLACPSKGYFWPRARVVRSRHFV